MGNQGSLWALGLVLQLWDWQMGCLESLWEPLLLGQQRDFQGSLWGQPWWD